MPIFHLTRPTLLFLAGMAAIPAIAAESPATQTIVMVRHGEKPPQGLGQLDCQGLNRALALPSVIGRFGRPDAIFAPDPAQAKDDGGKSYNYVRPLATIEPAAIAFGLPVDASIGFSDVDALRQRLESPVYRTSLVVVAWEHSELVRLASALLTDQGADASVVPGWKSSDFDGIYIVRITRTAGRTVATFERRQEGLNGQSTICPGPMVR